VTPYLRAHKPVRSQFRSPRRARPTGLVVVHTAESVLDTVGPDTGAEKVAAFIVGRTDPGSYHDLVDADSDIQLVRYEDEAYQDSTGSNPHALSVSFALKATDWPRLRPAKRDAFLTQGARALARQQAWLLAHRYPLTPLRRITRAQSAAGLPGFISHAERDPDRRKDPGAHFPWGRFFAIAADLAAPIFPAPFYDEDDDMLKLIRRVDNGATYLIGPGVWNYVETIEQRDVLVAKGIARPPIDVNAREYDQLREALTKTGVDA
jgi:hypothetical protein